MCNRYRYTPARAETMKAFGIDLDAEFDKLPLPELFPKRDAWVVREEAGVRMLDVMNWGFPPPMAGRAPVTNVRNLSSPFWRTALTRPDRRCLVPVSDFCEWEGEKGAKIARWFSVPSRPIFAFAGVWRPVETGKAFAFLTTDPNPIVEPIHPKAMPMILHENDYAAWLEGSFAEVCGLAAPYPSQLMRVE